VSKRHPSFPDARPAAKKQPPEITWKDEPADENYRSAANFLGLVLPAGLVTRSVQALRTVGTRKYNPHDLLRAARLKPAKASDLVYQNEIGKVEAGEPWSPVLLVAMYPSLIIADGYHRVSVAFDLEEQDVWARIVPCHDQELEGDD